MSTRWLTPDEAAEYLSVSKGTMKKWRLAGTGPRYQKLGPVPKPGTHDSRHVRYTIEELDAFAGKNTHSSTSDIQSEASAATQRLN
jgi:hypothetical protein